MAVHDIDNGRAGYTYVAHAFYNNLAFTLIFNYYAFYNLKKNVTRVHVTPSPHVNCFMKKIMLKNPYIPLAFVSSEYFSQLNENLHRPGTLVR
jgi:hypothetical protein